jgi:hypothetical protein
VRLLQQLLLLLVVQGVRMADIDQRLLRLLAAMMTTLCQRVYLPSTACIPASQQAIKHASTNQVHSFAPPVQETRSRPQTASAHGTGPT